MEEPNRESAGEIKRLRRCINDLVSVLALPAIWTGSAASDIIRTLLDALPGMLNLDFVYARLNEMDGESKEFIKVAESPETNREPLEIRELIKPWLGNSPQTGTLFAKRPIGDRVLSIVSLPLGLQGEFGLLVAGAERPAFPSQSEKLVLDVAANQAVIGLQEARLLQEQKRVAVELDARVAQRTKELAAANESLKKEIAEHRQAKALLRESERMAGLIVDNIPGLVALLTATGEVEVSNRQLHEYFGQTLEELKHWGTNGTVHPDDLPHVAEVFGGSIASGVPYDIVQRLRRGDGAYRWIQNSGFPLRDMHGQITGWCVLLTDIDERKRAEEALQRNERNLKLTIDTIPALVWSAYPDGNADFFNQHYLDYVGLSTEQMKDWGWTAAVHPDDLFSLAAVWELIMASEEQGEAEARLRRHDGVYRWFLFRMKPFRDEAGKIVKWFGQNTDITEQKLALEKLQEKQDLLDLAQKSAGAMAFDWYIQQDVNVWSPEQEALYGLAPGTFDGTYQGWKKLIYPPDWLGVLQSIEHAHQTGEVAVEFRVVWKDGTVHWLATNGEMFFDDDGKPLRMVGFTSDITRRKLVEEELRRSEAFLAEGQHLARTGNFFWRVSANEVIWSEQLYRIFEFESGTPVSLKLIASRMQPDDLPLMQDMLEVAERGVSDFEYEPRLLMPDLSIKYIHLVAHGTPDSHGQMEYIGAVQDVTQRRLSEEALNKARAELARVARVMSLGVLTASIAHEVNQPLSGIITNASTCLRMLNAEPPNIDGARETARRTIRDGNRASDVIKRLRALFGKKDLTVESIDLNEAAQEVIALSRSEFRRNQIVLQEEFAKNLPPVTGDRVQFQQVILNLLLNAMDAMSGVEDRPRKLTIVTELDGSDRVRLSVSDAGTGFASDTLEKLFDAFYTTKQSGMGIGLSVSRSIIERHQGRLWAAPNDGHGSVFSFSIPVQNGAGDKHVIFTPSVNKM